MNRSHGIYNINEWIKSSTENFFESRIGMDGKDLLIVVGVIIAIVGITEIIKRRCKR